MFTNRATYSIDHQRYNFQFGGQAAWEIRGGKVVGMVKDCAYQATTTNFWNALDMLGGRSTYFLGGTFSDGKGEPGQSNQVSHGCPAARFKNINVINTANL
jgi:TldD protein